MCGLFQPTGQVRLTNVATVRLKVKDQRFEIACYRNKIVNWRSGVENDIQEVLQCPYIFTSITKGKLANNVELMKAFNTTDINVICKQILDKGEFQVSKEEREQLLESTFKDIVNILHEVTTNPNTGRPLARGLLESALKSTGFSTTLNEPAKKQALKALSLLQKRYPEDIARSKMRLRITCLMCQHDEVTRYLKLNDAVIEHDDALNDNCLNMSNSKTNHSEGTVDINPTCNDDKQNVGDSVIRILFLCCPSLFRDVDNFVAESMNPPGSLQLVSLNVKDISNRRMRSVNRDKSVLAERTPKVTESDLNQSESCMDDSDGKLSKSDSLKNEDTTRISSRVSGSFKCTACVIDFLDPLNYRKHCKTDLHVLNSKRRLKGMEPISEAEFQFIKHDIESNS